MKQEWNARIVFELVQPVVWLLVLHNPLAIRGRIESARRVHVCTSCICITKINVFQQEIIIFQ